MSTISKLQVVPIRQAFAHEAYDFTAWLESHIEVLGERLNLNLSVTDREERVGDFIIDLVCETSDGRKVIIENQLERTNHGHLGQLLTYLVGMDAQVAIWISTDSRVEHQKVIEWLNENTSTAVGFYLIKVEAVRIGESPFAPLFTVLVSPDQQIKQIGDEKKEWAERQRHLYTFWQELLELSKIKTKLFSNISPGTSNFINMGAGVSGVYYTYTVSRERGTVELCIDRDKEIGGSRNKRILESFQKHQIEIEKSFGSSIEWERLEGKRMSRIRKTIEGKAFGNQDDRRILQSKMIDAMINLNKSLSPIFKLVDFNL